MNDMETAARRERLAATLETLAAKIRGARAGVDFHFALEELATIGRDGNGYHGRTLAAMFAIEDAEGGE